MYIRGLRQQHDAEGIAVEPRHGMDPGGFAPLLQMVQNAVRQRPAVALR